MAGPVLLRAAGYGASNFGAWAIYLDHSETATTPDGEPVLVLENMLTITDYDYAVRLDDPNVVPPLQILRDIDGIYNWIVVRYRDELANRDVYITPDDNANLTDTTSTGKWGRREKVVDAGLATLTAATNLGRRYLKSNKDPRFFISGPLTVRGYILGKDGNPVPASLIRPGKRVRIVNFLTDEADESEAGLTFTINSTRYTDADETCAIGSRYPFDLSEMFAQLSLERNTNP